MKDLQKIIIQNEYNRKLNDITHIQIYLWHQTYALLRMSFNDIQVHRGVHLIRIFDIIFSQIKMFINKSIDADYTCNLIYKCYNIKKIMSCPSAISNNLWRSIKGALYKIPNNMREISKKMNQTGADLM
jgi:hypothetical protein